jgi:hypothetical protein
MIKHPSMATCRQQAAIARAQALHFAALSQRTGAAADQRRRSWLNALRRRADAEKWERAAREAQRTRTSWLDADNEGYDAG